MRRFKEGVNGVNRLATNGVNLSIGNNQKWRVGTN